jgi:hypothetical protein
VRNGHAKTDLALGFITVVEDAQNGLFGGYLVLNATGRPLEFHCTAPIKPNRAQQILYGPTLEPYLFGEQIGHTLVAKGKTRPQVLCTDREPALAVREFVDVPVALVLSPDDDAPQPSGQPDRKAQSSAKTQPDTWRLDAAHPGVPGLIAFRHGSNRLAVPEPGAGDLASLTDRLGQLSDAFDLAEPFDRIRQAIEEARQVGR